MQDSHSYLLDGFHISINLVNHVLEIHAINSLTKAKYFKTFDDLTSSLVTDNICLNSEDFYHALIDGFAKKEICNQISISQKGKIQLFLRQHGKGHLVVNLELDKIVPSISLLDSDEINNGENANIQFKLAMIQNELHDIKDDLRQNVDDKFDQLEQRLRALENKVTALPLPNYNSVGSFSQISTDIYSPVLNKRKRVSEAKIEEMSKHHEQDEMMFNSTSFNSKFYKFSNMSKIITRTCYDKHWECLFCTTYFKEKYEILHFKLVKSFSNYIMIGIAPDSYLTAKTCFDKPGSFFFYCYNGTIYLDGVVHSTKSLGLNDGDILTMMIDLEDTVVCFLVNNQIIFTDIFPGLSKSKVKYYPCVETFNIDDTLALVSPSRI